jgi:hypothetical protein
MSPRNSVKIRRLPQGKLLDAWENGWEGRYLNVDLTNHEPEFPMGSLVEIEGGSMMHLGELQQWKESIARVLVEHSVDRAKLAMIHETWG